MERTLILYNGRCPICAAEISHYRKRAEHFGVPLHFEDLHEADLANWDLTADQAKRRLHARKTDGTHVSGLAAFAAIWNELPGLKWLGRIVEAPVLHPVVAFGYDHIAAPMLYHLHRRRERLGKAVPRA